MPKLEELIKANLKEGQSKEEGWHPVPGANLSMQSRATKEVWPDILNLAIELKCEVEAKFRWNKKGLRPGEGGVLRWSP